MVRRISLRRGRSLRRKLVCRRRSLRRFDRVGASRRTSRFGAEEQQRNLVSALAQIIISHPPAARALAELAATKVLEKWGIKEDGAIDENCPDTDELKKFLEKWDKDGGLSPVPKSTKFGVDPADKKAAMKRLAALRKEAVEADAAYKKAEDAYYEKLAKMEPEVLYTTEMLPKKNYKSNKKNKKNL